MGAMFNAMGAMFQRDVQARWEDEYGWWMAVW
jgi:hypothetical protein